MSMINVSFKFYSSRWHIAKALKELEQFKILSFDTETKGVYTKQERQLAINYLKSESIPDKVIPITNKRIALQVAANNGLSFPSLVNVTHFVFGISENESIILICDNYRLELFIWKWLIQYKGKLLIHNALFDLKLMHHRTGKYPIDYEDTALLAKCLTNNVDVWKSKVGLKDLMGSYYDPMWTLFEEYEPDNLKEPKFLKYASIDGAATIKLWYDIHSYMGENDD